MVNQDTPTHLDTYVLMHWGDQMAHLETIQDRLHCVQYIQMLVYLKQGELCELAR